MKTVYPALQVQSQATQATYCIRILTVILTGFYCPIFPQHLSRTVSVALPSAFHICQNSPQKNLPNFAGFFCESPGQSAASGPCAAGYFCLSKAVSPAPVDGETGGICPQGHYCPIGASSPEPCPPGYYSNSSRNTKRSDCLPCPAGQCFYLINVMLDDYMHCKSVHVFLLL